MKCMRLFGLVCGCVSALIQANIGNIKGTYDILKNEYKDFSIMHGAIAWETGTIRRMYDFGPLGKEINAAGKRDVKNIDSKTIQLLYNLFYRRPGTTSVAEFVVTKPIRELSDVVVAEFVADMTLYLNQLTENTWVKKYKEARQLLRQSTTLEKRKMTAKKELDVARSMLIKELVENPLFAVRDKVLRDLGKHIINAYLECAVEHYMPAYVPHIILQALLYAQSHGSKEAFMRYYQRLDENVQQSAHKSALFNSEVDWSVWQKDAFSLQQLVGIEKELSSRTVTSKNIDALYEKIVFFFCVPRNYPPEITYSERVMTSQGTLFKFSDCMETAFRNFLNFLSYDPETGKLSSKKLEERLGASVHSSLKSFYDTHYSAVESNNKDVHNAWVETVLSNIPYASYVQSTKDSKNEMGYKYIIPGMFDNEALKSFLEANDYKIVPSDELVREINPSLRNIIIVLNYLLGLNLFKEEALEEAFMRKDFVQIYVPKLASALKAQLSEDLDLTTVDKDDFTSKELSLNLTFNYDGYAYSGDFTTYQSHGEFNPRIFMLDGRHLNMQIFHTEYIPISFLLFNRYGSTPIFRDLIELFMTFFSYALDNFDKAYDLFLRDFYYRFESVGRLGKIPADKFTNKNIVDLFLFLASRDPDANRQWSMKEYIVKKAIKNGFFIDMQLLFDVATKLFNSSDVTEKEESLKLFIKIVERGEYYEEAYKTAISLWRDIVAAASPFAVRTSSVKSDIIELLIKLVEKERYCHELIEQMNTGFFSDMRFDEKFKLIKPLVEKRLYLKEALELAQSRIPFSKAVLLYELFVDNGIYYHEAVEFCSQNVDYAPINLLSKLVKKGYGYEEAIALIEKISPKAYEEGLKKKLSSLAQLLFQKGKKLSLNFPRRKQK